LSYIYKYNEKKYYSKMALEVTSDTLFEVINKTAITIIDF